MRFSSQDLTDQYISSSYQDVVQQFLTGSFLYFLDGYGNELLQVPSASYGGIIVTQDQTASYAYNAVSASYTATQSYTLYTTTSLSSSWASSSLSSSYSYSSSYSIASTLATVALIADQALTASYAESSSICVSASYAPGSPSISASYAFSSSNSMTASAALNSATASSINFVPITSSYAITSSYINGFPFDNITMITNQTASNIVVLQRVTGSFTSGFFNYTVFSSSNMRAGQIISGWFNNTTSFTDVATTDIGNTSQVTMSVFISQSYVQLLVNNQLTDNWTIKTTGTYI